VFTITFSLFFPFSKVIWYNTPMKLFNQLLIPLVLFLSTFASAVHISPAALHAADGITPNPADACPSGGCAVGQRLGFTVNYSFTQPSPAPTESPIQIQMCFYAPDASWKADFFVADTAGQSGAVYQNSITGCSGNNLIGGASTTLPSGTSSDSLGFTLRLGASAGNLLVKVFVDGALLGEGYSLPISVIPANTNSFAASTKADCGANSPCYVDSPGDLPGGLGTGLKDAIDAAPANGSSTITLLGAVKIKTNTVKVTQALTLKGATGSKLAPAVPACSNPMLELDQNVTLTSLFMDATGCPAPSRDLVVINNTSATLENSTLTGSNNAVTIQNTAGLVTIRFNQISGNHGGAILNKSSGTALLTRIIQDSSENGGTKILQI
jgi:hypothetical protein